MFSCFLMVILFIFQLKSAQPDRAVSMSPDFIPKTGFCFFCPRVYQWTEGIRYQEPERKYDQAYLIKKVSWGPCLTFSRNPTKNKVASRRFCIDAATRLINEHVHEFDNHSIWGNEIHYCSYWYDDCALAPKPIITASPEELPRKAFCYFCWIVYQYAVGVMYDEPTHRDDPAWISMKVSKGPCSRFRADPNLVTSRRFCISTVTTLVNDHLHEFDNHTIRGDEKHYCKAWYGCPYVDD